jgi:hypothetical protein
MTKDYMKDEIRLDFRKVIDKVVFDAWAGLPAGPHEPDYIARLVLEGTPEFHRVISSYPMIWRKVATLGVFCHQSPMVKYTDGTIDRRCELGDVLWCHFHTDIQGNTFRNALLFQSKMSDTEILNIPYDDTQLKLYREWPEYEYYRSGALNGITRHLKPSQPHAGAQYMGIDKRSPTHPHVGIDTHYPYLFFPIGTTTITPKLLVDTPLELELTRFLFWGSGRSFDPYNKRNNSDEWTKIVWDLLKNSLGRAFNRRRAGFNNSPRISRNKSNMDGMLAFMGNQRDSFSAFGSDFSAEYQGLFSNDGGDSNKQNYSPEDNDKGGSPSIIIFVTNESEGQKG